MTTSSAQATAFFTEVIREQQVWTIRDAGGIPAPFGSDGMRSMPFWSLSSRAERIISTVEAYSSFETVAIPLNEWRSRWLPGLERDGLKVGLNWFGALATGYDVEPRAALASLAVRESSK
ncbi:MULTISPECIES: DUF2750 domain-containing protein [unclassified Arthrobacter]|uniref:DUF2750 domain-containing protein n=1 Tax=unclassified Arthrobacter TaxID=235627 RepID=UPI001F394F50|nr:DUF2750 domain-containing protein [Arthrobacter sp. FW306-06-A]UKA73067.1 DUF2750 domain-containing protein [Arthrobacter sp. FW306-06-A]